MRKKYLVLIQKSADGYTAHLPELPTILVAADTKKQLMKDVGIAISLYFEEKESAGEVVPEPYMTAESVEYQQAM